MFDVVSFCSTGVSLLILVALIWVMRSWMLLTLSLVFWLESSERKISKGRSVVILVSVAMIGLGFNSGEAGVALLTFGLVLVWTFLDMGY